MHRPAAVRTRPLALVGVLYDRDHPCAVLILPTPWLRVGPPREQDEVDPFDILGSPQVAGESGSSMSLPEIPSAESRRSRQMCASGLYVSMASRTLMGRQCCQAPLAEARERPPKSIVRCPNLAVSPTCATVPCAECALGQGLAGLSRWGSLKVPSLAKPAISRRRRTYPLGGLSINWSSRCRSDTHIGHNDSAHRQVRLRHTSSTDRSKHRASTRRTLRGPWLVATTPRERHPTACRPDSTTTRSPVSTSPSNPDDVQSQQGRPTGPSENSRSCRDGRVQPNAA